MSSELSDLNLGESSSYDDIEGIADQRLVGSEIVKNETDVCLDQPSRSLHNRRKPFNGSRAARVSVKYRVLDLMRELKRSNRQLNGSFSLIHHLIEHEMKSVKKKKYVSSLLNHVKRNRGKLFFGLCKVVNSFNVQLVSIIQYLRIFICDFIMEMFVVKIISNN